MATQRKLDGYFTVTPSPTANKHKTCFIYDPEAQRAYFSTTASKTDRYVTKKVGLSLYYRPPRRKAIYPIPQMRTMAGIPLLKSNLQKSIRRGLIHEALQSALAIIQRDSIEFLRRLPIIYIEDVCLQDSYSIVTWLMIAEKDHVMDSMDVDLLLRMVKHLCDCMMWYDNSVNYVTSDVSIQPEMLEHNDALLSLYYRTLYGGMKCDMVMLQNALYYYLGHPRGITISVLEEMDYDHIGSYVTILSEAIDFHPFPGMLTSLTKQTKLGLHDLKMAIWFVESAVNIRNPSTQKEAEVYAQQAAWKTIRPLLPRLRHLFFHD